MKDKIYILDVGGWELCDLLAAAALVMGVAVYLW